MVSLSHLKENAAVRRSMAWLHLTGVEEKLSQINLIPAIRMVLDIGHYILDKGIDHSYAG